MELCQARQGLWNAALVTSATCPLQDLGASELQDVIQIFTVNLNQFVFPQFCRERTVKTEA
jgi:hypothetical protein